MKNSQFTDDKNFDAALRRTLCFEGGLTQNVGRKDEPTNMGIKQVTLTRFNKKHRGMNFPTKVDDLTNAQAACIYKLEYWDATKIPDIKNARIRGTAFDMNVMSGYKNMSTQFQESLNEFGLKVIIDGNMGRETISALNMVPKEKIEDFMKILKQNRMKHLQFSDRQKWQENKNGWTSRTMAY